MLKTALLAATAIVAANMPEPVFAWAHAGSWGGAGGRSFSTSASGSWGHGWSGSGFGSGGRSFSAGGNAYGWHATGSNGGRAAGNYRSWAAVGPEGHYATGTRYGYRGGGYGWGYHPPAVINHYYGGSGCYNCGGWAGAGAAVAAGAVGVAIGSAVAANAYAARAYYPGTVYAVLPPGCGYAPYGGMAYYTCNGAWFRPAYGANGTYYTVVQPPP